MKINWLRRIKNFVPKALKYIGIAFVLILIADIFSLIWKGGHTKKLASDEFIEKKIKDILGDDNVELKEK